MRKVLLTLLASLCIGLALAACGEESGGQIQYRFADKAEGQELLLANTEYYNGLTKNDLQYRMQRKDAALEEFQAFAKDQVMDFSDEQKTIISETMDRLEGIIEERGYQLPLLDEITFICSTMKDECEASAYTQGTQIFLRGDFIDASVKDSDSEDWLLFILGHELFHCLTRCNPDFRADMYQMIHFTVQEEEYELPPSVLEYYISNPDVEHHDAYATFEIDGKPTDCYLAFATKKHFKKEGDDFFDSGTAVLVPVDGSDKYYYPEDASNFLEVLGENTDYNIDPEECMADNFGYLIAYDAEGPEGKGYKTPEIIDEIRDYLTKQ